MAEIRLNKIIRQFNIGLDDLVNFLQKIGVELDANPNAKIDESYMPARNTFRPSRSSSARISKSSRLRIRWI